MSTTRQTIYQCIVDLCAVNRAATRQVIAQETGLKLSVVDDHVSGLRDAGLLRNVVNGVVEPMDTMEDRSVSGTVVPGGRYKLEIGDMVLELTLRETRAVAALTGGVALQFGR
jgi:hypothetical protein